MNFQTQIDKFGFYIKNTFICTQDELYINKLKRSKSLSDLNYNNNDLINFDFYKPNIDIYYQLLKLYIKKIFSETIDITLDKWLDDVYNIYKTNYNFCYDELNILNNDYELFNMIKTIFMDKNNHKKNIIELIIQLKNKISKKDKISKTSLEFVSFLEIKLQELFR